MQEMDCSRWCELASGYFEKTLPDDVSAQMEQHLTECADCVRAHQGLRMVYREMRTLPEVEPPLFFRENVIAAIERQQQSKPGARWTTVLQWNRFGRLGMGVALAGGMTAALAWTMFLPHAENHTSTNTAGVFSPVPPQATPNLSSGTSAPRLHLTRVLSTDAQNGPAYDVQVWLNGDNAPNALSDGTVRFHVEGDTREYRLPLHFNRAETLRIPLSVAENKPVIGLVAVWSVGGEAHTRQVYLPLLTSSKAAMQQSFGLADMSVAEAAREIAARFQTTVSLDDVPDTARVQINARQETAQQTLERQLQPLGLAVTSGPDAIEISSVQTASQEKALP